MNHRKIELKLDDYTFEVVTSPSQSQPGSVDIKVIDKATNETLKSFTGVNSHLDEEGLVVSSIDDKTIKSNVVVRDSEVVVFDEVRWFLQHDLTIYPSILYSLVVPLSTSQHQNI